MKGNVYTLFYAGILGTVCALLLTAANGFTKPYKEANAKAEKNLNVLSCLGVGFDEGASASELVEVFKKNIREEKHGELTYFVYAPNGGAVEAIAVQFSGPGLWGPIKGFLALEKDMRTIRGVTFYEQEETPGLGGEIATAGFQDQFKGKSITDEAGVGGMLIRGSGGGGAVNQVDAITGATMTCDKVQDMLNKVIVSIVEESK